MTPTPQPSAEQRLAAAWSVLDGVLDPEVPVVSVRELGIVREVRIEGDAVQVVMTPTYSGCPATDAIAADVREALLSAGLGPASVVMRRAPAWTTDWITAEGRRKLLGYGIVPPGPVADAASACGDRLQTQARASSPAAVPIRFVPRPAPSLACPHCASMKTERLSAFGSTACKALYRCKACGEPFEHFKPI